MNFKEKPKFSKEINDNRSMKTINLFIFSIILSTLLTGCMPDSLTQFKKDTPAKPKSVTGVPVTDASGNTLDPNTIIYPTLLQFRNQADLAPSTSYPLEVNKQYTIVPVFDGSMQIEALRTSMLIRCEIEQSGAPVTQALPNGLILNASNCTLRGTPLVVYSNVAPSPVGGLIRYKINAYYKDAKNICPGDECVVSSEIDLASYMKPTTSMQLAQNDVLVMPLSMGSSFTFTENDSVNTTRTDVISSENGAKGFVEIADSATSSVSVYRAVPLTVPAASIGSFSQGTAVSTGTKSGVVLSVDSTNNIIRVVRNPSSASFTTGDTITSPVNATISAVGSSEAFKIGNKVDSDTQFYSERGRIREIVQVYEVSKAIDNISVISDTTLSTANGVTYSISPAPPTGLSFSTSTGTLSGTFTEPFNKATFTITATNLLGSASANVTLEAYYPPEDLSYTNSTLLGVLNANTSNPNAIFIEGERIFRPKLASENNPVNGRIISKVSTNKLYITTLNGAYVAGNSLDSGKRYFSEKAQVDPDVTIAEANLVLKLSDATNFSVGGYISTGVVANTTRALGRIVAKDTNTLYVQFLTPSTSSVYYFNQGDGVDNAKTWNANEAGVTITAIEATNYKLTLTSAASFAAGDDITGVDVSAGPTLWVSGYVNDKSTNDLYISDTNKKGSTYWMNGYSVDVGERYADPATTTISNVSHDVAFYFENRVNQQIRANLSKGAAVYSVDKTLPLGLTLNTSTGEISGTPTSSTPRKTYIVRAKNLLGSTSYKFDVEVREFLKINDVNSNASSFQLHKTGTAQNIRPCRINAKDILNNTNSRALDIRCYLDGQEEDLYFEKLRLQLSVGGGICQYTQYAPYYFNKFKPGKTSKSINYLAPGSCTHGGLPSYVQTQTPKDICDYYYNDEFNCDEGSVMVTTITTVDNAGVCTTSSTSLPSEVKCNGKKTTCIQGPITDLINSTELSKGARSVLYSTSAGEPITPIEHSTPYKSLDLTNVRIANDAEKNFCSDNNNDFTSWTSSVYNYGIATASSAYIMPFAAGASTESPKEYGQPYYVINCLDAARDIKARIRFIVRDWDRNFSIADNIDYNTTTDGANSLKDNHGLDGFSNAYNAYPDWDDDITDTDGDGRSYELPPSISYSGSCGNVTTPEDGAGLDCYSSAGAQDPSITTPKACYAAGKKWKPGSHFNFPADSL